MAEQIDIPRQKKEDLIKRWITELVNNDIILSCQYLREARYTSAESLFAPEDVAQFILKILIGYFPFWTTNLVIPEEIIDFFMGSEGERINAIEATLRVNYFEKARVDNNISWHKFEYLNLLPEKSLFHLTNRCQKIVAAEICRKELSSSTDCLEFKEAKKRQNKPHTLITERYRTEALQRLAAIKPENISIKRRQVAVTIFGFHRALMGIGEDARSLFDILTMLGYRVELVNCAYEDMEEDPQSEFYRMFETTCPICEIAIFCMPLFEMARFVPKLTPDFFRKRYVIGYWPWELTSFPAGWREIANLVDQVWASSNFLVEVFRRECDKPVFLVPLCIDTTRITKTTRKDERNQGEQTTFISVFDFNSSISRKNPLGAVTSFKSAFSTCGISARLILKTINGSRNPEALKLLRDEVGFDERITIIDEPVSRTDLNHMISQADVFLSLHRSEGFGRLLAEAMLLEVLVIATDWSGTRDFVKHEHAFLVRNQHVAVRNGEYPYAAGYWAEPNLSHAADTMRYVAINPRERASLAKKGATFVENNFGIQNIANIIEQRLSSTIEGIKPANIYFCT